ncbi:MAG: tetratricopeptide repeat protein [Spirochaetota bacterium]
MLKKIPPYICAACLLFSCGKKMPDYSTQFAEEQKIAAGAEINTQIKRLTDEAEAGKEDTEKAKIYQKLCTLYLSKADYTYSIKAALDAVKYQPNLPEARAVLGASYLKMNRFDDAQRELEAALNFDEKNSKAHYELGNLHFIKGKYREAAEDYTLALKSDASYYEALNNRGSCYAKLNDAKKAEADFLKTIALKDDFAPAHKNLGILYETKLKNPEKAVLYYKKYLDTAPNAQDRKFVLQWIRKLGA